MIRLARRLGFALAALALLAAPALLAGCESDGGNDEDSLVVSD
jgi:hypothetical protein